ncbi:hypothetical protein ACSV4D_14315 [Flavobacterium sp. ARAG 55.4]|uniref:hypothetical protein n=1 Tax=Flavobacterium sp. ARAG 55.4 TaxID=3451357 RepID=UPI003F485C89
MALINPHINFNGNAKEAFTFYQSVFGGEFVNIIHFKDIANSPLGLGFSTSPDRADLQSVPATMSKKHLTEMLPSSA